LAYRSTYNAFFRDLLVSSFVFHSSLLTVKNVNLVVACNDFLCVTEIIRIFIVAILITEVLFKQFLICNELNIADREGQWILQDIFFNTNSISNIPGGMPPRLPMHISYCSWHTVEIIDQSDTLISCLQDTPII